MSNVTLLRDLTRGINECSNECSADFRYVMNECSAGAYGVRLLNSYDYDYDVLHGAERLY